LINKILVLLDGSRSLDNALYLALDLAEKYSAEVLLLSVVSTTVYPSFTAPTVYPRPHEVCSTCRGDFADPYVISYFVKKFHRGS